MAGAGSFPISITWQVGNTSAPLQSINQVQSAFGNLQRTAQQTSGSMGTLAQGMAPLTTATNQFGGAIGAASSSSAQFSGAMRQSGSAIQGVSGSLTEHNTLLGQGNKVRQKDIGAIKAHSSQIISQVGSVTGLSFAFTGLFTAMGEARGMQELLALQEQKVADEQAALNALVAEGITGGHEYTQQQGRLEKAQRGLAFQTRTTNLSVQDQFFFIASIAGQALPRAVTGFTKLREIQASAANEGKSLVGVLKEVIGTKLGSVAHGFSGAIGGLAERFNTASISVKGMTISVRSMMLAFLPLAAVSAILILISKNTFGFRDALNAAGKALGDWIPFLRPVLEGIKVIGSAMGLTGEQTVKAAETSKGAMERMTEAADDVSGSLSILGDVVVSAADAIGKDLLEKQKLMKTEFKEAGITIEGMRQSLDEGTASMTGAGQVTTSLAEKMKGLGQVEEGTAQQSHLLWEAQLLIRDIFGANLSQFELTREKTMGLTGAYELADKAVKEWGVDQIFLDAVIKDVTTQSARFETRLAGVTQMMNENATAGIDMSQTLVDIENAVFDISSAYDQLDIPMQKTVDRIKEWITEGASAQQVAQLISAVISGELTPAFLNDLDPAIRKDIESFLLFTAQAKDSGRESDVLQDSIFDLASTFNDSVDSTDKAAAATFTYSEFLADLDESMAKSAIQQDFMNKRNQAFAQTVLGITNPALLQNTTLINALVKEHESLGDQIDRDTIEFAKFAIRTNQINGLIDTNGNIIRQNLDAYKVWGEAIKLTDDGTLDLSATIQELGRINQDTMSRVPGIWAEWFDLFRIGQADVSTMTEIVKVLGLEGTKAGNFLIEAAKKQSEAWGVSTDAAEENKTVIEELSDANADAATTISEWITAMEDGSFVQEQMTAGLREAELAHIDLAAEILNTRGELEFYTEGLNLANEMQMQFIEGMEGVTLQLIEQAGALAQAEGELIGYVEALKTGVPQALAFAEGQLEAEDALLKTFLAAHQTAGAISQYAQQLAEGRAGAIRFAEGQLEVLQAMLDSIDNMINLAGQIKSLNALLKSAHAQSVAFAEGLLKGGLAATQLKVEASAVTGEWIGFRDAIIRTNPELLQFGDLTDLTNERLAEMALAANGSIEAIRGLAENLFEGAAAFKDFITSVDFRDIDDNFEDAIDDIRDGIDDMIDLAEDNGVKITDAFAKAMEFGPILQQAGEQMKELWPIVENAVKEGIRQGDPSFIDQGIGIFTERMKKSLREADVEGEAKIVVDNLLAEIDRLKDMDPSEALIAMQAIRDKIDLLAEGKTGLADVVNGLTSLNHVPVSGLVQAAEEIDKLATTIRDLDLKLTPEQIDQWARSLADMTGVPVDQLKILLDQRLSEAGESATSAFLEAGPGGDAARAALAQQMGLLHQVFVTFTEQNGLLFVTLIDNWAFYREQVTTETSTIATILRTNLNEWGTWANNIIIVFESLKTNFTTFTEETMPAFTESLTTALDTNLIEWGTWANQIIIDVLGSVKTNLTTFTNETMPTFTESLANVLRTNIDAWGEWANNILTATETAGNNAETMTSRTETMTSNVASTLRSNIDDWGNWANGVQTAADHAADSFSSAMSSIRSSANSARSAVERLRSAIASLRSKTITITTRFRTIGRPAFQHGGSFIVDKPSIIGGKQVGEFSKPELVTVTPLTNPNNINDKNINISSVKRAVSADTSGKKGSIKKEVLEPIIVTVDGEVIMRLVQRRLLEFAGDNII